LGEANRTFDGRRYLAAELHERELEMLSLSLWAWVAIGAAAVVAGIGMRLGITDYLLDRFG